MSIKHFGLLILLVTFSSHLMAQDNTQFLFEPSSDHPFGLPNPAAPKNILDYAPLIGESTCTSISRSSGQEWADPVQMKWRFKYIMNGYAIQDETLKSDGTYAGSIRQYIPDSSRWYVHYYSHPGTSTTLPAWEGNKTREDQMILYRPQQAPNGMDGYYKITFDQMTADSFTWLGEWVNVGETFSFPTWKIECQKRRYPTNQIERENLEEAIAAFSQAYINADYDAIADAYTQDGKILPNNTRIIEGREAIKKRWTITNGSKILHHKIKPEEIKFMGDYAYDYGYYEGRTQLADGNISTWKGKYVIVWKKVEDAWKMYLDIWNRVPNDD